MKQPLRNALTLVRDILDIKERDHPRNCLFKYSAKNDQPIKGISMKQRFITYIPSG